MRWLLKGEFAAARGIYQLAIDGLQDSLVGTSMPTMRTLKEAGEVSCLPDFSQC